MRLIRSAFLAILFPAFVLHAQAPDDSSAATVRLSGGATLSGDFYDMGSTPSGAVPGRRPPSLLRLLLNLNLSYGQYVSLPFNLMISSRQTNVVTPFSSGSSLGQALLNPLNALSLSPQIGWARFYLGTHTQTLSELSGGDAQIFGLGVDLRPGQYRVAASAGFTQRAVEADTLRNIRGAFARTYYALKLGYGKDAPDAATIGLNIIRSKDDPGSIAKLTSRLIVTPDTATPLLHDTISTRHPLMPIPAEGALASFNVRAPVIEGLMMNGEVAASIYTRDMEAGESTADIPLARTVMKVRTSTRSDYAASLGLSMTRSWWSVDARALYIRPGFYSMGYPFLAPDRLEFTLSPRLTLFDGDLGLNATVGQRTNNLSGLSAATSTQLLVSGGVQAQITDAVSLAADYTNFGLRNTITNDTFKVESVSQTFSLTPTVTFGTGPALHTVSATFALDDYTDFNTVTGSLNNNSTRTVSGVYSLSFSTIPLTFNLSLSNLVNNISVGDLLINSGSVSAGYRLLQGRLTPSVSVGLTQSRLGANTDDIMLNGRLGINWAITKSIRFNLAALVNKTTYGSAQPGVSFTENYLQSSLSVNF